MSLMANCLNRFSINLEYFSNLELEKDFLTIFPVAGIITFRPPGTGCYWMRVTASYFYEGLVAAVKYHSHKAIYPTPLQHWNYCNIQTHLCVSDSPHKVQYCKQP